VRHHLIGIIALLLLLGALASLIWPLAGSFGAQLPGACLRVGAVVGAWWLAYNELRRVPAWLWIALLSVAVVVAAKPRVAVFAIPIILVLAILKPRLGRRKDDSTR